MNKSSKQKDSKGVLIFRSLALFFLIIELLILAGGTKSAAPQDAGGGAVIGYYLGYNFPLWLAILFFYLSYKAKKKYKNASVAGQLDSIGKNQ